MLVQDPNLLADVGCLVFDEVHYLADPERGTAWEESILLAPTQVPLVCLSATVGNAREIAEWLQSTGREVIAICNSRIQIKGKKDIEGNGSKKMRCLMLIHLYFIKVPVSLHYWNC